MISDTLALLHEPRMYGWHLCLVATGLILAGLLRPDQVPGLLVGAGLGFLGAVMLLALVSFFRHWREG